MADEEVLEPQADENETAPEDAVAQDDAVEQTDAQEGEDKEPSLLEELKESIECRVEEVGALRKKLTISVPADTLSHRLDEQYGELRRDAAVPGFRRGRAPRRLLEKRFGSEVGETLVQQLLSTGYMAAIEKTDLKVLGDPLIWVDEEEGQGQTLVDVTKAIDLIELPDEGTFTFACEVEIRPEFELPELENIPLEKPVVTVTDDDVTEHVVRLRSMGGTYHTVTDGEVQADDQVVADLEATSGESVLFERQEGVRLAARPQQIDGIKLEALGEALVGKKVGDVVKASGEIPEDYAKEEFRSKQADFEIKITEIQRLELPPLDETFISGLGFESEQDLRDWVKSDLESRIGEEIHRGMTAQIHQFLLENVAFEVPERLSERQTSRVVTRRMVELYQRGVPPQEVEKHLDELKTGAKEDAVRDMKLFFVMEKLSEEFEVEVGETEINGAIAAIAQRQNQRFDRVRDELAKGEGEGMTHVYLQIRDRKIVDRLIDQAKITETEPGKEEGEGKKASGARKAGGAKKKTVKKKKSEPEAKPADDLADET